MKSLKDKKNNSKVYRGTYKYYGKYRPGIPKKVVDVIVEHFNVKPSDRIIDIGCGTGQVALAMGGKFDEMVCVDPDLEMIKWGKKLTKDSKENLTWINRNAETLQEIKEKLGFFKLATSSRSFHRTNQDRILKNLDEMVIENGGVALFSDRILWSGNKDWQQAVKKVILKHLKDKKWVGEEKPIESDEVWENILSHSPFKNVKTHDVPVARNWEVKNIIGYIFSTAAAPYLFKGELDEFKKEIRNTLLSINKKGVFQENAVWHVFLGSRKSLN